MMDMTWFYTSLYKIISLNINYENNLTVLTLVTIEYAKVTYSW